MKTLGERVKTKRLEKGWSQQELADKSRLSQTTIADIERGRNQGSSHITNIANALGEDPHWLATGHKSRHVAAPVAKYESDVSDNIIRKIPVISWVQAGDYQEAVDNYAPGQSDEIIESAIQVKRHTFALKVRGDSMEPDFPDGCYIIVEPDMEAQPGDFVIAKNGDQEATFKQLVKDGSDWYLKPINPRYPLKPISTGSVICGVVREMIKKYR